MKQHKQAVHSQTYQQPGTAKEENLETCWMDMTQRNSCIEWNTMSNVTNILKNYKAGDFTEKTTFKTKAKFMTWNEK
jgi:hypothetical protein